MSLSSLALCSCASPFSVNWLYRRLEVKKEIMVLLQMLTILMNVKMAKEDNNMINVTVSLLSHASGRVGQK